MYDPDETTFNAYYPFVGDYADAQKMQPAQIAETSEPWWEGLLKYGATRAIDSHFNDQDATRMQQTAPLGVQAANGYTMAPGVQPMAGATSFALPQGWQLMALLAIGVIVVLKAVD